MEGPDSQTGLTLGGRGDEDADKVENWDNLEADLGVEEVSFGEETCGED